MFRFIYIYTQPSPPNFLVFAFTDVPLVERVLVPYGGNRNSLHACSEIWLVMEVDNVKCLTLVSSAFLLTLASQWSPKVQIWRVWTLQSQCERKAQRWSSLVLLYCSMPEFIMFDCTFCQGCCCFISMVSKRLPQTEIKGTWSSFVSVNPFVNKMFSLEKKILCCVHRCDKILSHCEPYSSRLLAACSHVILCHWGTRVPGGLVLVENPPNSDTSFNGWNDDSRKSSSWFVSCLKPITALDTC